MIDRQAPSLGAHPQNMPSPEPTARQTGSPSQPALPHTVSYDNRSTRMHAPGNQHDELATIRIERHADRSHAHLAGEIDMSNAGEVYQQLLAVAQSSETLVVDLSELSFIDSAGVAALDRLNRTVTGATRLHIIAPDSSAPGRTLALAGMDKILPMWTTEES